MTPRCAPCRPGKEHVRSAYYAYPMVDTKVLLKSIAVPVDPTTLVVDETDKYFVFEKTGFKVPNDDEPSGEFMPTLLVSKKPLTKISGAEEIKSPDFMLAGVGACKLNKAYFVRFVHPKQPSSFVIWSGYVNMAKPQIQMNGILDPVTPYILSLNLRQIQLGIGMNILAGAAAAVSGGAAISATGGRGKWMKVSSIAGGQYDPFAVLGSSNGEEEAATTKKRKGSDTDDAAAPAAAAAGDGEEEEEEQTVTVKKEKKEKKSATGSKKQ